MMKKKLLSFVLALALCVGLVPAAFAAGSQPAPSKNKNKQSYELYYGSTVKSHLYQNETGGLTRVEYIDGQVVIENYDSSFRCLSGQTISPELPIWGGFYAGQQYNFLIFGQSNRSESDSTEVIRVVKYDKNWNRLAQASLYGANTSIPFDAGSLRCAEGNGYLYIRTSHQMYKSQNDGKNHQASLMLALRESDMTFTKDWYGPEIHVGYVSHSFNQFILIDQQGRIVSLDHGDARPRAALLQRYSAKAGANNFSDHDIWTTTYYDNGSYSTSKAISETSNLAEFPGAPGKNDTGCTIGGLEEISNGYVAVYNKNGLGAGPASTVYLSFIDEDLNVTNVPLSDKELTRTPILAPTGLDGGYVLWQKMSDSYPFLGLDNTLFTVHYDANGNVGPVQTTRGSLSDCAPIQWNGKTVWYATNDSVPTFYTLDASGMVQAHPTTGESTSSENPAAPVTPAVPEQSTGFSDVPSSHWAHSYIQTCANKGIVSGIGNGKFDPEGQVTYAQFCVMLINAFYPEALDKSAGGTWYTPYTSAARKVGLLSGTGADISDAPANVSMTRNDMALVLGNALAKAGAAATPSQKSAAQAGIKDWNLVPVKYQNAVSTCFALKLLSGLGDGSFGGSQTMTRAQACVVLTRLEEVIQRSSKAPETPTTSTEPTTPSSSDSQLEVDFSPEYMSSKYYRQLKNVTLTGDYRHDMLAIALSQIGYCEGNREDQLDGSYAGSKDYTEYGRYLDSNGTAWCSEFASWCARAANVPTDILSNSWGASVNDFGAPYYSWSQTVYAGGSYTPRPGDLALFAWNGKSHTAAYLSHTAIVYDVKENGNTVTITTIDGNSNNSVRLQECTAKASDGNVGKGHLVYFVSPNVPFTTKPALPTNSANPNKNTGTAAATNPGASSGPQNSTSSGTTPTYTKPTQTPLPADGRVDRYRREWGQGNWLELEVLNGDTVRFTGCIPQLASYYNYAVLWVISNHQEVPIYPNVPFEVETKVDIAKLEQMYNGDISVATSHVTAMICQNHTPGSTSLGGFSLGGAKITLALNGRGGCTLQVVE